jgi:anthranilate synthase component 1
VFTYSLRNRRLLINFPVVATFTDFATEATGAPKISAMEILHGLEGIPRGIDSGCLGYISTSGSAALGMTI